MAKAQRKINRLRRKKAKQEIKPRIPVAKPSVAMKSKKDYDRKNNKKEVERELND